MKETYLGLKENVALVNGAKRGVLQDLNKSKVYSIDELSLKYLNELIEGASIEKVLCNMELSLQESFKEYLELLEKRELIYYSKIKTKKNSYDKLTISKRDLKTVWFELRRACNLNCCHCYLDCDIYGDKNLDVLTIKEWKHIVDELKKFNLERIILIGGEPLLFKGIESLIEYIKLNLPKIDIILYSNLTMLNDSITECIVKNNVKIITSIYSNIPEIHDIITRKKGSFDITVSNIKKLKNLKVYVKANTTILKYNMNNINDISEFTYKLTGIHGKFDVIRDVGISKKYLIPGTLNKALGKIRTKAKFRGINKEEFLRNISGNTCWQGKINITCDGKVSPCIMGNDFIKDKYNIRTESLTEIIEQYIIPEFWSISKDDIEECRECEYRYVCKDCRPVCADKNNIYSKGKLCTYNPYSGIWKNL